MLTKDEILKMQPGSELDTLVGELVMGWESESDGLNVRWWYKGIAKHYVNNVPSTWIPKYKIENNIGYLPGVLSWSPSYYINNAWEVVEHMPIMKGHVGKTMLHHMSSCNDMMKNWSVQFCSDFGYSDVICGSTAQLAICYAAIIVMMD